MRVLVLLLTVFFAYDGALAQGLCTEALGRHFVDYTARDRNIKEHFLLSQPHLTQWLRPDEVDVNHWRTMSLPERIQAIEKAMDSGATTSISLHETKSTFCNNRFLNWFFRKLSWREKTHPIETNRISDVFRQFSDLNEQLRYLADEKGVIKGANLAHLSERVKDNSVELLFFETPPFGHALLRVGRYMISFNSPMDATFKEFSWSPYFWRKGQVCIPMR
ncbi:MAG: hypothetical protein N2578_06930 [Bdellovibrionaceae bacterium]|nr:hypothetical protein [Pseudobdellovibrionaceae bacterium]